MTSTKKVTLYWRQSDNIRAILNVFVQFPLFGTINHWVQTSMTYDWTLRFDPALTSRNTQELKNKFKCLSQVLTSRNLREVWKPCRYVLEWCFFFFNSCWCGCKSNTLLWRDGAAKSWKKITPKMVRATLKKFEGLAKTYPSNWCIPFTNWPAWPASSDKWKQPL